MTQTITNAFGINPNFKDVNQMYLAIDGVICDEFVSNSAIKPAYQDNVRKIAQMFVQLDINGPRDILEYMTDIAMFGFPIATAQTKSKVLLIDLCQCLQNKKDFTNTQLTSIYDFKLFFGKNRIENVAHIDKWFGFKYANNRNITVHKAIISYADRGTDMMDVFLSDWSDF